MERPHPAAHDDLFDAFPALRDLEPMAQKLLSDAARPMALDAGSLVFEAGQDCARYILVLSGSVRVHLLDADGHEVVLYRVARGDTCVLTTAAVLGAAPYAAYAITEAATMAASVPRRAFEDMIAGSAGFRRFVFAAHGRRIADLMAVVSDVAFTRIRVRLARCLLHRADALSRVTMTHEALAIEIGTAREVVSRNLKAFERGGLVQLGQGALSIVDPKRLAALAGESA